MNNLELKTLVTFEVPGLSQIYIYESLRAKQAQEILESCGVLDPPSVLEYPGLPLLASWLKSRLSPRPSPSSTPSPK